MTSQKLKVCLLTSVHRPFDHRIFYKQARSLANFGYDVNIIAPSATEKQYRDNVTIHGIPPYSSRLQRPRTWYHIFKIIKKIRPDIIRIHDPELLLMTPFIKLSNLRKVPIIYDVHEFVVDSISDKVWIPNILKPVLRG